MYSTSISPSTLFTLALLAGSSLSLPNLLGRDDTPTIKCSDDFPIQHVCKVTGEAKPLDVGNDNSDYNIIFNVYAPARKDQDRSKPWPYLANTWQQVVKNADWKKKDYELDIPAVKDGRFAGQVDAKFFSNGGDKGHFHATYKVNGQTGLDMDIKFDDGTPTVAPTWSPDGTVDIYDGYYSTYATLDMCAKPQQ
ncbi:MAG: hypothetical protein Q9194_006422 [Teloschistes cf. exilis]